MGDLVGARGQQHLLDGTQRRVRVSVEPAVEHMGVLESAAIREQDLTRPPGAQVAQVSEHLGQAAEAELSILRRKPEGVAVDLQPVITRRAGVVEREDTGYATRK